MATTALRDGSAFGLPALKLPTDRRFDDSSIEAATAVECEGGAHVSRCKWIRKRK